MPVVCTGLAGGRTGTLIVEDLTHDGILNDFVRIDGESRTSTVLLDPTSNVLTEIYEWGPEVAEPEIAMLGEKLSHFGKSADYVVFAGSLPRGVDPNIYAELIRAANKAKLRTVLDAEGEALARWGRGRAVSRVAKISERQKASSVMSSQTRRTSRKRWVRSQAAEPGTSSSRTRLAVTPCSERDGKCYDCGRGRRSSKPSQR